jgi:hypothetical protein
MKRLIPKPVQPRPEFDPAAEFPQDVDRLVAAAKQAGFMVSRHDAGELWRRHSDGLCATWLAPPMADDQEIVRTLLSFADVTDASTPSPPTGYSSWLDYAVDTMETRSEQIDRLFEDVTTSVSRDDMRAAVRAELDALRRLAAATCAPKST